MKITERKVRSIIRSRLILERKDRVGIDDDETDDAEKRKQRRQNRREMSGTFSGRAGGGGDSSERTSEGSAVVIEMPKSGDERFDNPTLIYVYPGIGRGGYGQQSWVADRIEDSSSVGSEPNRIVVIAQAKDTPWSSVKSSGISAYERITGGEAPRDIRLVGWSAGAQGLADAAGDSTIGSIWYADPVPSESLISAQHGANVKMYYNPENWDIEMDTDSGFERLASRVSNTHNVDQSHNEIFDQSMREALG